MLSATIVIDYQNVQLVALNLFNPKIGNHQKYLDPLKFSKTLIEKRNRKQKHSLPLSYLNKILVYRGLPSFIYDKKAHERNLRQAEKWEKNRLVEVHHRPLKYFFEENTLDNFTLNRIGKKTVRGKREKGIDVLCALALVREARTSDLVILASQDTDLIPAIEEAVALKQAKIETFSWYSTSSRRSFELRSPVAPTWNTRLGEEEYFQCLDENTYGV